MSKRRHMSVHCGGFTLVEAAFVAGMLAVLSVILFSVFSRSRVTGNRARCDVQLKSLALALDAYRQEQGNYPGALTELQTASYLTDKSIMHCPADPVATGTYADYYVIREAHDDNDLPLLVCPFHEADAHGAQAYVGRYTTQFMTKPAVLIAAKSVTLYHPGKAPIAAPAGLELHGADRLVTARNGSATVQFADTSVATMKKESDLTILQCFTESVGQPVLYSLVRQTSGNIRYYVNPGSKFDVSTPVATAGALGTRFDIEVEGNYDTTLTVLNGKVRFNTSRKKIKVTNGVPVKAKHP